MESLYVAPVAKTMEVDIQGVICTSEAIKSTSSTEMKAGSDNW